MADIDMLTIRSLKPLALIPSEEGMIGRFSLQVEATSDEPSDPWDVLNGIAFSAGEGALLGDVRLMSARSLSGPEAPVIWDMTAAALFDDANARFVLKAEVPRGAKGAPSASFACVFPKVMAYDFRAVTEHPVNNKYPVWLDEHRASETVLEEQRHATLDGAPTFSIVVPLYQTPLSFLEDAVGSVLAQTYPHWQLILVNASPELPELAEALSAYAEADRRIEVIDMVRNEGIVGNTNAGIAAAMGDFVGFMDHDDKIEPNLLFEYAQAVSKDAEIDFLYCDEDLFDDAGHYFDPLFKPDFNLDLLRTHNYVTHLYAIRRSLLDNLELPGPEMEGAQDYDLTFKAIERARRIAHIPQVLYHWRAHDLSTNVAPASKPYAQEAGRLAIQHHLDRTYPGCEVRLGDIVNTYVVDYPLSGHPKVSVIIPNKDQPHYLRRCVDSLFEKAGYDDIEVVIVENGSTDLATYDLYLDLVTADARIKVAFWEGEGFNYSALINFGVAESSGEYLLLLNNDTEAQSDGFMRSMLGYAMRPDVGVVGAKLLFADETIQHAGVSVQFSRPDCEPACHLFRDLPRGNGGYHDRAVKTQDYSAVTGACQMVSRQVFEKLGGYDESLAVAFNDVDFCLKARQAGYLVVYDAQAELVHHESVSRGFDFESPEKVARAQAERETLRQRWARDFPQGDPYLNPNYNPTSPYCKPLYRPSVRLIPMIARRLVHRQLVKMQG